MSALTTTGNHGDPPTSTAVSSHRHRSRNWCRDVRAVAEKNVLPSMNLILQDIFRENPVMPGVLIIEALAQTGAVAMLSQPMNAKERPHILQESISAKFKQKVVPGDTLDLRNRDH